MPALENLPIELLAKPKRIAQQHQMVDPKVAVDEVDAAPLELHHQIVDAHDELLEVRGEVGADLTELTGDRVDALPVGGEQLPARLDHGELFLCKAEHRIERSLQFHPDALLLGKHPEDVILERLEIASRPLF